LVAPSPFDYDHFPSFSNIEAKIVVVSPILDMIKFSSVFVWTSQYAQVGQFPE